MLGCLGVEVQRLSHIGICVTNLEASVAFYRDALGFAELSRLEVSGPESDRLLELSDVALRAVYLERDGFRIELLHYPQPGHVGAAEARPMNQLGLTHFAIRVGDLDEAIAQVERHGGALLAGTRIRNEEYGSDLCYVTDPDGVRLELVQVEVDPTR